MKSKALIIIFLLISTSLMAARVFPRNNAEQFREGTYIHIDNMVIEFNEANATVNIEYHLAPFAYAYTFFFGSKNLEPKINEVFANFKEVKIQKMGYNSATIQITNISKRNGENYMHESTKLGMQPDALTIVYPRNQGTKELQNQNSTLNIFYPAGPKT
jgi:hypothetical protein